MFHDCGTHNVSGSAVNPKLRQTDRIILLLKFQYISNYTWDALVLFSQKKSENSLEMSLTQAFTSTP